MSALLLDDGRVHVLVLFAAQRCIDDPLCRYGKCSDTVGEFGVGRLFPEMAPRQPGPTSGLKVHFTNDRGRCGRSAEFANSVPSFLHPASTCAMTACEWPR